LKCAVIDAYIQSNVSPIDLLLSFSLKNIPLSWKV
jgi:hypothetical protein